MKAILLAAARGVRRLQPDDSYPRALLFDNQGRRVLDWICGALSDVEIDDVVMVGGYHIEKLIKDYPGISYFYNSDWASTDDAFTLFKAREELDGPCLISETNVIYHGDALTGLLAAPGDIVVATPANAPKGYAGLVKLSAQGARTVADAFANISEGAGIAFLKSASIPNLLDHLAENGAAIEYRQLASRSWASADSSLNMARFVLGSKSQTLERLRNRICHATILEQVRFTVGDWAESAEKLVANIASLPGDGQVIVRSSALDEDSWSESRAGRYHSVLDVDSADSGAIEMAVNRVIESFGPDHGILKNHEIFVQPFLSDIKVSGVVFTRDMETQAPYVVINFDSASGKTDTITGGKEGNHTNCYALHGHAARIDGELKALRPLIEELKDVIDHDALDIEFAIDRNDCCYLLQVRPLATKPGEGVSFDERDLIDEVNAASEYLSGAFQPHPHLKGTSSVLANMPDWNPAEVIGSTPRPLAASLYSQLITDSVWAKSRAEMGYRVLEGTPLMVMVVGQPYIDVRASFNSLVPAEIPDTLAEKLVNHYISRLREQPQLQDKIEFEITFTCYDFSFPQASKRLQNACFSDDDIQLLAEALRKQTDAIVKGEIAPFSQTRARIAELEARRAAVISSPNNTVYDLCRSISLLLSDCQTLGTLPFANVARQGFIASSFLRSLERLGVFSEPEIATLHESMPTVARDIVEALTTLSLGKTSRESFLDRFGHLRPGTYDLLSPSYDKYPSLYLDSLEKIDAIDPPDSGAFFSLFNSKAQEINRWCEISGLAIRADNLSQFIFDSIPGREWAKFEFTKNLSATLELMRKLGTLLGISDEDLTFLPIQTVLETQRMTQPKSWPNELHRIIEINKKYFAITQRTRLPSVIANYEDAFGYTEPDEWPNFISQKTANAPLVFLDDAAANTDLSGKIIAIESADPGYDWLFGHGIAGLVTRFGGIASHMAIRCAEFGLPAAIGCGEKLFSNLRRASVIELNCADHRMTIIDQ